MKYEIFITTSKREKWCKALINDIKEQGKGHDYNIRVFHDFDGEEYRCVQKLCKGSINYYRTLEHMKRERFWLLNNLMYSFLDTLDCDIYIQMPDDVLLVDGFFDRAAKLIESEIDVCNFFTPNIHKKTYSNRPLYIINDSLMWENNWVDCCFVAKKHVMKGFRIEAVNPNRWTHRKHTGSGVGCNFVKAYNQRYGRQLHQTLYSLCEHIGAFGSSMHEKIRAEKYYHIEQDGKILYQPELGNPILLSLTDKDTEYMRGKINMLIDRNLI